MMGVGLITTLMVSEPTLREQEGSLKAPLAAMVAPSKIDWRVMGIAYFQQLFVAPITSFFAAYGRAAWAILALVSLYRLSDIVMGVMANPFYLDQGYSKAEIASIAKGLGFGMSIFGAFLGGLLVVRFGVLKTMLGGALLVAVTNLMFAFLAEQQTDLGLLAIVISLDNLSGGVSATSFVAYLSGLTQREFTATQYALFSSLMTLPGKLMSGFSGVAVDALGYYGFFVGSAILGLPAIALTIWAIRQRPFEGSSEISRGTLGPH